MTTPRDAARSDADSLSPERWAHVRALVEAAVVLPREARPAFLDTSCGADRQLRGRVERLVAAHDLATDGWGFLARPAGELVAPLVATNERMTSYSPPQATEAPAAFCAALAERYAIGAELGRGGMATVYVAEDLRHHRRVAIKVLDPQLGARLGAERFLSEIRVTANLQHPNLLPLFDSGEASGLLYYAMPLIGGATLRARLQRERQLPVEETVRIVCAIAGALDYAHRQGIVHRDLKPENILLQDGQPLVADFGIALAVSNAAVARVTATGLSLGTPQYMSPEQAMGDRVIDGRSDVYSLAAVAYEMLGGEPPHVGATAQAVIGRMLSERAPSARVVRPTVPEHVDLALQRALEKLPADRWPTAAAFASALSTVTTPVPAPRRAWPSVRRALPWAAIPLAVAAGVWLARRPNSPAAQSAMVLTVTLPTELRLIRPAGTAWGLSNSRVAIAPDASLLVLAAIRVGATRPQLYLRRLNGTEVTPIPGTEGGEQPFFSSDGEWIGFMQNDKVRKVRTAGGTPTTIAEMPGIVNGLSWGPGDVIVFGRGFGSLMQLSATGDTTVVAVPDTIAAESFTSPQFLPDGKTVLATRSIAQGAASVVAVTLATGDTLTVVEGASSGRYVHTADGDRLIYVRRDGVVMAAPFDLPRRRVEVAVPVASVGGMGFTGITVALDGTFAFQSGLPMRRQLVIRELDGTLTTLTDAGVRSYRTARFSTDGKQIVAGVHNGSDALANLWTYDLDRRTPSRLTTDESSGFPEYSPDGQWISYNSLVRPKDRELLRMRVGGGTPETFLAAPGQQHEGIVTPDGATLVYREINARTLRDIWAVDLTRPAATRLSSRRRLAATSADEFGISLSPDGKWLAFTSAESGGQQPEVYVRPLADAPGLQRVSPGGGGEARWDPLGHALFYRNGDTLFRVAVDRAPTFRLGARSVVFTGAFERDALRAYDISPDGRRILLLRDLEPGRIGDLTVVLHALDAVGSGGRSRARE